MADEPTQESSAVAIEPLSWKVNIGNQMPQKRLAVAVITMIVAVVGYMFIGGILGALVGVVVMVASTAELFMPVTYQLNSEEARSHCGFNVTAIRWENVKRLIDMPDGVRLSPLEKNSRLDAFRGVYLRFSGNQDEVLGKIAELIEEYGSDVGRETHS